MTDGGSLAALRYDDIKITCLRQNSMGMQVWKTPFEELRFPMMTRLRMDPFERAVDEAPDYNRWAGEHVFFFAPATEYVTQWIASFRDFPQSAKQGTFGIDQVIEKMTATPGGGKH